jgi:hypothetical protein
MPLVAGILDLIVMRGRKTWGSEDARRGAGTSHATA